MKTRNVPLTVSRRELLPDGSDANFRRLVHGLLAFAARLESIRGELARTVGLTAIQYTVLISVAHLEGQGEVSVSMVADHLKLSGAFVTIETGKLARMRLLTKLPDPQDRRRVSLRTTSKGRELLESLAPAQVPANDLLFAFLNRSGFEVLLGMLDGMIAGGDRALALLEYLKEQRRNASC